jgi:hypothetical protein
VWIRHQHDKSFKDMEIARFYSFPLLNNVCLSYVVVCITSSVKSHMEQGPFATQEVGGLQVDSVSLGMEETQINTILFFILIFWCVCDMEDVSALDFKCYLFGWLGVKNIQIFFFFKHQ